MILWSCDFRCPYLFRGYLGAKRRQTVAPPVRAVTARNRFTRREAPAGDPGMNLQARPECRTFGAQVSGLLTSPLSRAELLPAAASRLRTYQTTKTKALVSEKRPPIKST